MSNLSPSTVAINTIAHCVANAADAAAGLDASLAEDLRSLLRLAAREVDRVRKANRKAAAAAKRTPACTGQSETTSTKSARKTDNAGEKPKARRRKAQTVNGAAAPAN